MKFFDNLFNKVPVDVTKSSGYDEPNEHFFTAKCGQLVVADITEILPADVVSLGVSAQIQLPPMATDFYGKVDGKFFTFFVPHRLVYGGFESTVNSEVDMPYNPDFAGKAYIPGFGNVPKTVLGAGSLADYLGFKIEGTTGTLSIENVMPFLSYHLIWDEWFRDSRLQTPGFVPRSLPLGIGVYSENTAAKFPGYVCYSANRSYVWGNTSTSPNKLLDGTDIFSTRQINWSKDYFTNATTSPQSGNAARLVVPLSVFGTSTGDPETINSTGNATISMTSLFGLNALQRWKQIKNISGGRYGELQYSIFGVYPESYICDRPIYLGQQTVPVYNRSVFQQGDPGTGTTQNPFTSIGAKYASPLGVGSGTLVQNHKFTEYGYLITLFALVPSATYSSGVHRMFNRYRSGDFADPTFAGIGDQDIRTIELTGNGSWVNTFGYTQRFSEYKFKMDRVSGLLRDGQSLASFALQRSFSTVPALGSSFLEIPQNYLDQVAAVNGSVSTYGCWVDAGFACKIVHKLPAYSIGTMADPKFVDTLMVKNGGVRLS